MHFCQWNLRTVKVAVETAAKIVMSRFEHAVISQQSPAYEDLFLKKKASSFHNQVHVLILTLG